MTDRSKFTRATANGSLQSLVTNYNANLDTLETELENTLNRKDDVLPNSMEDVLDMNSNRIINMSDGVYESDAVTKRQLEHSLATYQLGVVDKIDFYPTPTDPPAVGRLMWNNQDGTLDLGLKGDQVVLQIGQEQVLRVVNKTDDDLLQANYQCVKISGAQGQRPKVALALANNDFNSTDTIGLVTETILKNEEGFVTTSGLVRKINTTGSVQGESWIDGDILYLSATVAGKITNVKPVAPAHTIVVGFVVHTHATQGSIFVKVDNGYELEELHNVQTTTRVTGDLLKYNSVTGLWENSPIANNSDRVDGYHVAVDVAGSDPNTIYFRTTGGTDPSAAIWGDISGSIVDQTDLYNALVNGTYATGSWNINAASVDGYSIQVDGAGTDPNTIYFKTTGGGIGVNWEDVANTPTTIAGYGITDAFTEAESDARYLGINATAVNADKVDGYHVQVDGSGTDPNTIYLKTTGGEISVDWDNVLNTPTTIAGYGITDAFTEAESDARFLGINATAVNSDKVDGYHVQVDGAGTDPNTIYFKTTGGEISVDWDNVLGTPTTLAGYGITDAFTEAESDARFLGINATASNSDKVDGYHVQVDGAGTDPNTIYFKTTGGALSVDWGNITGTLSAQTDLQSALDGKYSTSNPSGYITASALTPYAPLNNPTFTGTVSGITKAMVGLGNVDNTADATKSVSYAATSGNSDTVDGYHVQVDGAGTNPNTIYFKTTGGEISVDWDNVLGTPTTIAGYGITDAFTETESDARFLGISATAVNSDKVDGYHVVVDAAGTDPNTIYFRTTGGTDPSAAVWGSITGTLSAQTDLQTALNGKTPLNGTGATGTWGINVSGSAASVTGLTLNNSGNALTPDSAVQNQLGYTLGVNLFSQVDGGMYSSAYNNEWVHQIFGDFRTGQIATRGKLLGTWQPWRTVLDSSNHTSYSPSLSGTGATGTWPISVSGSSAATPLLSTLGEYVWSSASLPNTYQMGMQTSFVGPSGFGNFPNYGSAITARTYNGGGGTLQMYVPYSPTYGGTGLKVRFGNYDVDTGNSWTAWKTLLADDNYNTYVPTLTGGGASGSWGIDVTGNANTVDGYHIQVDGSGTDPNTIYLKTTGGTISVAWADISSKPTTVSGYGITDAVTLSGDQTIGGIKTLTSKLVSSGNDYARLFESLNTSAGSPTQFYVEHNLGSTNVGNARGTLNLVSTGALTIGGSVALTASNYNSYAPTLTGGNASGTWGIDISGTSASTSAVGGVTSNRVMMKRRTRIHTDDGTSLNSSIAAPEMGFTYGGSGEPMGPYMAFGGLGGNIDYSCQLVGAYIGGNDFRIRTRNDDSALWNPWRTLLTDGNYQNYPMQRTTDGTNGLRLTSPAGGSFVSTAPVTGAIKIRLPAAAKDTNTMVRFTVKIYVYATGYSRTIDVGGYNYSAGNWINCFATQSTQSGGDINVRFGQDATGDCVWIGDVGSVWDYPQVFVTDVQCGYSNYTDALWGTGWNISVVTALDTVDETIVARRPLDTANYNSYAPTLTGTGASGTWGINVTGNANTASYATSANQSAYAYLSQVYDNRAVDDAPSSFIQQTVRHDFKERSAVGNPPSTPHTSSIYSYIATHNHWIGYGGGGGAAVQLNYGTEIDLRYATSASTWSAWKTLLSSTNYNSYAPTLTGGGASGTWPIGITGNANTVDGYHVQVDGSGTDPNTIYFKTTGGVISVDWANVLNEPTTVSGYGITDAVTTSGNQTVSGNKTFSGTTALAEASTVDSLKIGYRNVPLAISNGAKTIAQTDAGKGWYKNDTSAYTYTIPDGLEDGTIITLANLGSSGNITVSMSGSEVLRLAGTTTTGSRTIGPYGEGTFHKVGGMWLAGGQGVT